MIRDWRVREQANAAADYARVECQILDLDLAIDLLDRVADSPDFALVRRTRALARQTFESIRYVLPALHPDDDQKTRISHRLKKLGERLSAITLIEEVAGSFGLH